MEETVAGPKHIAIEHPVVKKVVGDLVRENYLDDSRIASLTAMVVSALERERLAQMREAMSAVAKAVPEMNDPSWALDVNRMVVYKVRDASEIKPNEVLDDADPRIVEKRDLPPETMALVDAAFERAYLSESRIASIGAAFVGALTQCRQAQVEKVWNVIEIVYPEVRTSPHRLDTDAMVVYPIAKQTET